MTDVIGTSSTRCSGQSPCHISRETSPCSSETPFAYCDVRSANGVSPKPLSLASTLPSATKSSHVRPQRSTRPSRLRRTSSGSNTSFPAGTGVCVVNTVDARSRSSASARRELLLLDELAHPLELEERRVSLVQVEDRRLEAEAAQHAHAADAEHELLPQPVLAVAAVERVGDVARPVGVALDLRVEQVERDAADPHAPDAEPHRHELAVVVGELDDRSHRHELERQAARVVARVALDLPVVLVELLPEVAAAVEEADADERDAELRRRLEVVAGEDAEPAGVDREALVEPELRGEVGDEEIRAAAPRRATTCPAPRSRARRPCTRASRSR